MQNCDLLFCLGVAHHWKLRWQFEVGCELCCSHFFRWAGKQTKMLQQTNINQQTMCEKHKHWEFGHNPPCNHWAQQEKLCLFICACFNAFSNQSFFETKFSVQRWKIEFCICVVHNLAFAKNEIAVGWTMCKSTTSHVWSSHQSSKMSFQKDSLHGHSEQCAFC